DGDQFSQRLAAGNVNRVATHLATTIAVTDNRIVVDIIDLGAGNPPENASIKAIAITQAGGPVLAVFHRGDADDNGALQLTDALRVLGFLFLGGPPPTCLDAGDADDNGALQLTDALRILGFLFLGGPPPSPPGPPGEECAVDPTTDDELDCVSYTSC
ncbi:MAG TPA: hypothetical protein VMT52_18835, partial [Planctomycetota bacterium]|nr:hypothetical protein [Planctomycetota bacterium]